MDKKKVNRILKILYLILVLISLLSLFIIIPQIQIIIIKLIEKIIHRTINHEIWRCRFIKYVTMFISSNIFTLICLLFFSEINFDNIEKDKKSHVFSLIIIILFSSYLLIFNGIPLGHDFSFHLMRIEGIADELKRGHFPVRMQPLWLNGYGYPVSIYYGDILLYIPAVLRLIGISLSNAYKIYCFIINIGSVIISFFCFKIIFKSNKNGLILSLIYNTASYKLLDIYVRTAVGEYTALMFLPIISLAFYNLIYKENFNILNNATILAVGMTGLILTHILSTELICITLVIVCIIYWRKILRKQTLICLAIAVLETLLFSAFFVIPFIDYFINVPVKVSQLNEMKIQNKAINIIELFLFFRNPWGYDSELLKNRMLLTPGLPLMFILITGLIYYFILKKNNTLIKLLIISLITILFSSKLFPWDFISNTRVGKLLCQIQFAWRWLGITIIFLTLISGYILILSEENIYLFKSKIRINIDSVLICLVLINTVTFSLHYLIHAEYKSFKDYTYLENNKPVEGAEYIRQGTDIDNLNNDIVVENVSITNIERNGNSFIFNANSTKEGYIELPVFNYKGYQAITDNNKHLSIVDGTNNVIRINIPENFDSTISVIFKESLIWKLSSLVSLFSVIIIIFLVIIIKEK